MACRGVALMVVLGLCLLSVSADQEHDSRNELLARLFEVYQPLSIPRTPVNVSYTLDLLTIDNVDEKQNLLRISVVSRIEWSDHRFQWDPADYSGITFVNIPAHTIWEPDFQLPYSEVEVKDVNLRVYSNGFICHYLQMNVAVPCEMNFANYPYDVQTCTFRVESWSHSEYMMNVTAHEETNGVGLLWSRPSTEWEVQDFSTKKNVVSYPYTNSFPVPLEPYGHLFYTLRIKRVVGEYTVRTVALSVVTSLLIPLCFLIPPLRGSRLVLCVILLLCVLLQLHQLNLTVPINGPDAPFLADFLCFSGFLTLFAVLESVVSMNLSSWENYGGSDDEHDNNDPPKDGETLVVPSKPNALLKRVARFLDLGCFVVFTFIVALGGGVILNPKTE